ncbi:hypothetical protein BT63DRAFT_112578 [Microthyrium microscopicum]|uniref:Uncharacterized protein n=1 Tax=Microthyrium microscopicum TaxID=703497 RepID=A0A6A6TWW2_9PEZI|nr:hypothetical protein BT63DRAFT_112578 [Microthyrium microscopicum]
MNRRNIRVSYRKIEKYFEHTIHSGGVIRIPVEGGLPAREVVDICMNHDDEPIPLLWLTRDIHLTGIKLPVTNYIQYSKVLVSEKTDFEERTITICAERRQAFTLDNKWYCDLIKDFHNHEYDLKEPSTDFRGDLYIFQTVSKGLYYDLVSIEKEDVQEIVQKCRDELQQAWKRERSSDWWDYLD